MQNEKLNFSSDKELMQCVERCLYDKWKGEPATVKQKRKLKKMRIPFDKNLSKAGAYFLLREVLNRIKFPNDFVEKIEKR
ncbi:MAG: hypothetical protein JSR57_09355 [Verrucomicrobia bacterium]|nr:hypothetical protein [Verrucomicrobiota bacterium]